MRLRTEHPDLTWQITNVHLVRQGRAVANASSLVNGTNQQGEVQLVFDGGRWKLDGEYACELLKQFGREGLEKIAANAVVVQSSGQVYKSVSAGEYPVGITIEASAYEFVAGGQKEIKLVYPSEGTYLGAEGMFIVKGAKNAAAAKQLYDVLLSKPAQELLLVENFRRPTRSDIAVSKLTSMPDLASLKVFPLNLQVATEEYEQLISIWNMAIAKAKR